jgi:Ca2+-binding EF-hand superfamily protein
MLRVTFKEFDKDGSGQLEDSKFKIAWRSLGLNGDSAAISEAFHSVDTDRSGVIDMREFMDAFDAMYLFFLEMFLLFNHSL